ncbi:unnamed protein product [Closterium sp. NIES-54]
MALYWPNAMLQVEEIGMVGRDKWKGELLGGRGRKAGRGERGGGAGGRGEEEEEDDGEVWEEVKDWGFAVLIAWRTDAMIDLIDDCRSGSSGGPPRKCSKDVATELCNRSLESRFCEEWDHGVPPGSSSTFYSSDSSSRSSKEGKGKREEEEEEVPAHLKAWPGGVNLVACLQEMLLGEPCYHPAPAAAPSTATGAVAAPEFPAPATGAASAPSSIAANAHQGSEALGGSKRCVCGASGCGTVEGGGMKLRSCSGCGKVAYCGRECQKAHWPSHKLTCPGRAGGKKSEKSNDKVGGRNVGKGTGWREVQVTA